MTGTDNDVLRSIYVETLGQRKVLGEIRDMFREFLAPIPEEIARPEPDTAELPCGHTRAEHGEAVLRMLAESERAQQTRQADQDKGRPPVWQGCGCLGCQQLRAIDRIVAAAAR